MEKKFESLKNGEVICVGNPLEFLSGHHTFRVSELSEALKRELLRRNPHNLTEKQLSWLSEEGKECAVLKFDAPGWQKGKLRIDVQFCPDESEAVETPSEQAESLTPEPQFSPEPNLQFFQPSNIEINQQQSDLLARNEDDTSEISQSIKHELEAVEDAQDNDAFDFGEALGDTEDEFDFQAFDDQTTEDEARDDFSQVWQDIEQPN